MTNQTIFEKYGDEPTIMDQLDWTGNSKTAFSTLGASNHSEYTRAADDFYETPAEGVTRLLDRPDLAPSTNAVIWECAAGRGAISNVLTERGYSVYSTELRDRGFGETGVDFLTAGRPNTEGHPLVILTNPPFKCLSSDTQCFTKRGWLAYQELKSDDEIMSVNPNTLKLEWSKLKAIVVKDHDGEMYHFKKSHVDLLVTKDHRMFAHRNGEVVTKNGDLIKSQDVRCTMNCPRVGYSWEGKTPKFFTLPKINGFIYAQPTVKEAIEIETAAWIKFFAFWLADGYCRHTKNSQGNPRKTVGIKQLSSNADEVRNILKGLPFKWKEYIERPKDGSHEKTNFEIHNEQLWSYLLQFGTSETKFIPEWIKNCDTETLKMFLEFYLKGDGSSKNGINTYRSTSRRLMEDVQEILLKTGYLSHITTAEQQTGYRPMYIITESRHSMYNKYTYPSNKNERLKVSYKGRVWCPVLEKNGVFLCRRNGFEIFTGNCALPFIKHSLELLRDGESCYFLLRLSFLEGQKRQAFFEKQNPEVVAVFGKRITCNRNGSEPMSNSGAVAFAWFKWTKGYIGKTTVEWI